MSWREPSVRGYAAREVLSVAYWGHMESEELMGMGRRILIPDNTDIRITDTRERDGKALNVPEVQAGLPREFREPDLVTKVGRGLAPHHLRRA